MPRNSSSCSTLECSSRNLCIHYTFSRAQIKSETFVALVTAHSTVPLQRLFCPDVLCFFTGMCSIVVSCSFSVALSCYIRLFFLVYYSNISCIYLSCSNQHHDQAQNKSVFELLGTCLGLQNPALFFTEECSVPKGIKTLLCFVQV